MEVRDFEKHELLDVQAKAVRNIERNRSGRIDPLTANSHTDHWLEELPVNIEADLARGKIDSAKSMCDFWLDRVDSDGRTPHMIINTDGFNVMSLRRRFIDRRILKAKKLENGEWATPLNGPPLLSSVALRIAESLPEDQAEEWVGSVLPKLNDVKEHHFNSAKSEYDDGLLTQYHQDEMLLRDGTVTEHIAENLEPGSASKLEEKIGRTRFVSFLANALFKFRGDYDKGSVDKTGFDPKDTSSTRVASKLYPQFWRGKTSFRVQDVAIQAMFVADNEAHERLCEIAGVELPEHLEYKFEQTKNGFNMLWDDNAAIFASRNPDTGELLTDYMGVEPMVALIGRSSMSDEQLEATLNAIEVQCYRPDSLPLNTGGLNRQDSGSIDRGAIQPSVSFFVYEALDENNSREARLKRLIGNSVVGACVDNIQDSRISFSRCIDSETGKSTGRNQEYWGPTVAATLKMANDLATKPELQSSSDR